MTTKVFDRKTIALALQSALLITTSCKCAFKQTQPGNNGLEARRLTLAAIAEGTTEGEVLHNLGNPDEVRQRESPSIADEAYRWAYGVRSKGEFANIGMVIFATNKTVLKAYCPTKPRYYRNPADVPIRSIPERTKTGLFCVIESVEAANIAPDSPAARMQLVNSLRYSLVNEGTSNYMYVFKQPTAWIKFNLVVEVFDSDRRLVLREDYSHYGSGDISRMEDWETVTISPGNRVSEDFPIWLTEVYYGKPSQGRYFVRVLFPFETARFYSSNLMEFWVP